MRPPPPLARGLAGQGHEPSDVVVVERVVDHLAVAAVADEARALQDGELVADRGLAHAEHGGEVADAELRRAERVRDAEPGRVGEHLEELGGAEQFGGGQLDRRGPLHELGVDDAAGADLDIVRYGHRALLQYMNI